MAPCPKSRNEMEIVSMYQPAKNFNEARDNGRRQWHQLDNMEIIHTSFQTDNHASTSSLNFLQTGCSFWRHNQQRQRTEDTE